MKNQEIAKKDYFSILWQGKGLILLISLIAAVAIVVVYALTPKSYQASSIVTLRGRNIITGGMNTNMKSPYTNSAYIADIINEPFFSEQVFSRVKISKQQGSIFDFLSGRQIVARRDTDTNIVYINTYGRTPMETKALADEANVLINERIDTINTSSPGKIQKEIYRKLVNPIVEKIDKIAAKIEIINSKKGADKTENKIKVARLKREAASLKMTREKYDDYLAEVTLSDMTSRPRLEVVMAPVVSKPSKKNILSQIISAAIIGLMFGMSLVLVKDYKKDRDLIKK